MASKLFGGFAMFGIIFCGIIIHVIRSVGFYHLTNFPTGVLITISQNTTHCIIFKQIMNKLLDNFYSFLFKFIFCQNPFIGIAWLCRGSNPRSELTAQKISKCYMAEVRPLRL